MAKTFYGYQQRDAESQINWAEVGKNFSDMLSEEARVREEKKAAIDEATRETQRQLNETPHGQNDSLNTFALKYATDAQEVMLIQERMLKSGRLKPGDYTVMRQNLVDGTDAAFSVMQTYQDEFARKFADWDGDKTQFLNMWLMENAEGFGNFNRSKLVINPQTGEVNVAFMDEDGKFPTDPTKFRSLNSLKTSIGMDFKKYDLEGNTSKFVEAQGTWQQVTRTLGSSQRKGLIEIMSDPMNKTITRERLEELGITDPAIQEGIVNYYAEAEQDFIGAQLSNEYNTSSILTDYTNAGYTFTFDPNQRGGETILLTTDSQGRPVPDFTEEQKAEAESVIRNSLRNKMSTEIQTTVVSDYTQPRQKSQYEYERGDEEEEKENIAQLWADIYSADENERGALLTALLGSEYVADNRGIDNIVYGGGKINIINSKPDLNRTIDVPNDISFEEWMQKGTEFYGGGDVVKTIKSATQKGDYRVQAKPITNIGERKPQQPVDVTTQLNATLSSSFTKDMFFDKDNEDTLANIEPLLVGLGFNVDANITNDKVKITNPETGAYHTFTTDGDTEEEADAEKGTLISFILANTPESRAEKYLKTRSGGMGNYN